mgnify:CR=1 FL=1
MKTLFLFFTLSLFAADEIPTIEVTAQKISPVGLAQSLPSSVSISREDIELKQYKTVYEALRDIPGVDVLAANRSQTTSIFIRGSKSEQTLVYVDGVEFNDPTDPGRGPDLTFLDVSNVERIEVIRGAQSVLFPGVGGVINIVTRSGFNQKPEASLKLEGGSFGTVNGGFHLIGSEKDSLYYSLSGTGSRSDGLSASVTGTEKDGNSNIGFSSKLGKIVAKETRVELTTRYYDAKQDLDLVPVDTPNYQSNQQNLLIRLQANSRRGMWEPTLGISTRFIDRKSLDYGSTPNTRSISNGGIYKADWINRFKLSSDHQLTQGLEYQFEKANIQSDFGMGKKETDASTKLSSFYLQYDYLQKEGFYATVGARADYHSQFYLQHIERIAPGYFFKTTGTTLRGALGTGFKSPSLYQLFGEFGNSRLDPETALSSDLGVEQNLFTKRLTLLVTYFRNDLRNLIDFDFASSKYVNVSKVLSQGFESSLSWVATDNIKLESQYTYNETRDANTQEILLRRPKHKIKTSLVYSNADFECVLDHLLVGSRTDIDPTSFKKLEMPTYHLVNLSAAYSLFQTTRIFARLENLLNTQYQAINGYTSAGLSFFIGVKQTL